MIRSPEQHLQVQHTAGINVGFEKLNTMVG